jgi:hypothetical protein
MIKNNDLITPDVGFILSLCGAPRPQAFAYPAFQESVMTTTIHPTPRNSLFGDGLEIALAAFAGPQAPRFAPRRAEASAPARQPRLTLLDRLDGWFTRQEQRQREAYLAQSQDICDLERRIRHLERHGS